MSKKQNYINNSECSLLDSISSFKNDMSKKTIKNYIKNKMVMVNDKVITNSSYIVNDGDEITINYSKTMLTDTEIDILYEDDYLIAINKPSGLLSIGNDKERNETAYRMVSDYVKKENKKYIFVVHRIDQDTSGVLLFCKDQKIRDKMQDNWNTIVKKRGYIAIVEGIIHGDGTYHSFLREDRRQFVYSDKTGIGKEAITHYQVVNNNKNYSMVQVFIDTGRRNQIRVHFSEHGHALVGDKKYGCKSNPIKRLCLHANILEFIHPVSKKLVHIESKTPEEFLELMK